MITEENYSTRFENATILKFSKIIFHAFVHRRRIADVIVTECVRPEQAKRWIVSVSCGEVNCIGINVVCIVLESQTELERVFVLYVEKFLGGKSKGTKIMRCRLLNKASFVIVECADARLILSVSCHVAAVLEVFPDEWTFFCKIIEKLRIRVLLIYRKV